MIALTVQSWVALAMVAVAAGYLGLQAWRTLRGTGSGPGCCGTGCLPAKPDAAQTAHPSDAQSFIPLDNFTDLARRHKQDRDRPEQSTS